MTIPTITALPPAPLVTDNEADFSTKAFTFVDALTDMTGEINTLGTYLNQRGVGLSSYLGTYNAGTTYAVSQSVVYLTRYWISNSAGNIGNTPADGSAFWAALDPTITNIYAGTSGGSANAQTITSTPATTSLVAGQRRQFIAGFTNTLGMTLADSGLTAKSVTKNGTTDLTANDIITGDIVDVIYDGTKYQIIGITRNPVDSTFRIVDDSDQTKKIAFQASGITTATTRTMTVPDLNGTLSLTDVAQTVSAIKTHTAAIEMSGAPINNANITTIASAGTVNLDTATSDNNQITGTTAIGAITLSDGNRRAVLFSGALTLINSSTLILPGAANIQTASGDTAVFIGDGGGGTRCHSYTRANGKAIIASQISTLTGRFKSSAQTLTLGSSTSVAHGLGVVPEGLRVVLQNISAELNYIASDEVDIQVNSTQAGADSGILAASDASNVKLIVGGNNINILNKTTFVVSAIDVTKWKLIVRAWS